MEYEDHEARERAGLVACDDAACTAVVNPVTIEELQVALAHWRGHRYLYGCSHGGR